MPTNQANSDFICKDLEEILGYCEQTTRKYFIRGGQKCPLGGTKKCGIGGQALMGGLALDGGGPPIPIHWTALPETHILRSGWLFVAEPSKPIPKICSVINS